MMASIQRSRPRSFLAPQYVNGVYIPWALLVVGTAIVKREWTPFAMVIGLLLGGWKIYNNREWLKMPETFHMAS